MLGILALSLMLILVLLSLANPPFRHTRGCAMFEVGACVFLALFYALHLLFGAGGILTLFCFLIWIWCGSAAYRRMKSL